MEITTDSLFYNNTATHKSIDALTRPILHNSGKIKKCIADIQNLPAEIHHKISGYLDPISYANARETCQSIRNNFESFETLNRISIDESYRGELKQKALSITYQRELETIKKDRDIMAALTNLKVYTFKLNQKLIYGIDFSTREYIDEEKKEQLFVSLLIFKKLRKSEFSDITATISYNVNIGFNIMLYSFYHIINNIELPTSPAPNIKK